MARDYDLDAGKLLDDCGELPEIALGDVGETGGEQLILAAMTGRQPGEVDPGARTDLAQRGGRVPQPRQSGTSASSMIPRLASPVMARPPSVPCYSQSARSQGRHMNSLYIRLVNQKQRRATKRFVSRLSTKTSRS